MSVSQLQRFEQQFAAFASLLGLPSPAQTLVVGGRDVETMEFSRCSLHFICQRGKIIQATSAISAFDGRFEHKRDLRMKCTK